jgi:hypothetical protein
MRSLILLGALILCASLSATAQAQRPFSKILGMTPGSIGDTWAQQAAAGQPWHGQYYYLPYGQPTALVVPPTAAMQQNYSWGVSQNTMTPIYHQYGATAVPSAGGAFYATPRWPSNTGQFGVYPVRAPW